LLEIILLHFCGAVTKHIYTNRNRTACIHARKFKLGLKVEEECSYHLVTVSAPQYSRFSHNKFNLIILLTHHVIPETKIHSLNINYKSMFAHAFHLLSIISTTSSVSEIKQSKLQHYHNPCPPVNKFTAILLISFKNRRCSFLSPRKDQLLPRNSTISYFLNKRTNSYFKKFHYCYQIYQFRLSLYKINDNTKSGTQNSYIVNNYKVSIH
jgi:hypothetical protein